MNYMFNDNIQFMISHFKGQEYLFPRSIMTAKTNGQVSVDSKDQIIKYFTEANYVDSRINGYPYQESERSNLSPSFIFIDLDLSLCSACKYPIRKLDYILKQTLRKIQEEMNGQPTVLWTGGGYHIYQPIKIATQKGERLSLTSISDFKKFLPFIKNDLTTEFMRFAGNYLTDGKNDPKHNPSIKSCLIRIPETINSKYNEKVTIVQKWDGNEANAKNMLIKFIDHLIQRKTEYEASSMENQWIKININKIGWIEQLLDTPLEDHRYFCLWHILIPYLMNIKKLPKDEIISILTKWLDDCNRLNRVRWNYPQRIKEQLRYVKDYAPISLENLKKENFKLYKLLQN
jgi:hypothetical protein